MGFLYLQYAFPRDITWKYVCDGSDRLEIQSNRVLGVHIRGTDFKKEFVPTIRLSSLYANWRPAYITGVYPHTSAKYKYYENDIEIKRLSDDIPIVDVIVVTPILELEEIKVELQNKEL